MKLHNEVFVSISYEDYYPNIHVIKQIAKQLKKHNIIIVPYIDDYMSQKSDTNLRLEIRTSMLNNMPILFYKADIFRGLLTGQKFDLAIKAYSYIVQNPITKKTKDALLILDKIFTTELISLPLLILPKAKFVTNKIIKNSIFAPGEYIYYE
jgi:hypothetical protein